MLGVDEVIVVTNDEICAAIKDIFEDLRSVLEPAGALAVAGLKRYVEREKLKDKHLIAIASEEVSLNRLFPGQALDTREPPPGSFNTWSRSI